MKRQLTFSLFANTRWLGLCILSFCCISMTPYMDTDWSLEKDKNGVKVYTRYVDGWGLKEFKGEVKIKTTLQAVEATLRDAENRGLWMHNTYDTKDLKKVSNNDIYTYSVVDAPWPVSDRDNITHWDFDRISDKAFKINMSAAPDYIPEVKGVVRITRLEGHWYAEDLGNGYIKVVQQARSEAGGSVPAWLANSSVVDSPYNTLLNLKNRLESDNGLFMKN